MLAGDATTTGHRAPFPPGLLPVARRPHLDASSIAPAALSSLPLYALSLTIAVSILAPAEGPDLAPWPFLVALVFCGLPHGAVDGMTLFRGTGRFVADSAIYLAILAVAVGALWFAPALTVFPFLILSVVHFGVTDARWAIAGRAPRWIRPGWALGRGGVVIWLPFASDPTLAWEPFAILTGLIRGQPAAEPLSLEPIALLGSALSVGSLLAVSLAPAEHRIAGRHWVETLLLAGMCWMVHPLLAVGVYFLAIHAFRQTVLLGHELSPGSSGSSCWRPLIRTHVASIPLMVPSLVALAILARWLEVSDPYTLACLSIGLYIVATPAHHWLELRRQGR